MFHCYIWQKKNATNYFAASEQAAKYLFANKKYKVITNGIYINKFAYNEDFRREIRRKYNIPEDKILLGNVGRLVSQKNQQYLFKILKSINSDRVVLMLVGGGSLQDRYSEFVHENDISQNVIFVSASSEIEKYYSAFDLFLLPSLYEGLGIVLIEAQAAGLPCIASKYVPNDAKVSEEMSFLGIEDGDISDWVKLIKSYSKLNINREYAISHNWEKLKEYDISYCARNLQKEYENILNNEMIKR